MAEIEKLRFLTTTQANQIASKFGTPVTVYSERIFKQQAAKALNFPAPYGLTIRYAMKANPNHAVLKIFDKLGIHIDASSGFEAERAMRYGIKPAKILLTSQELPSNLKKLIESGVLFNACSLRQLDEYGRLFKGAEVSIRINPGLGSGMRNRLNTGGPAASFGIWHEYIDDIKKIAARHSLKIVRVHNHIGTGSDPELWKRVALLGLNFIHHFPDVTTFNLGGGFKVPYMQTDIAGNLKKIGSAVARELKNYAQANGIKLHLEIEPGRFLVANGGTIISRVHDLVNTGEEGYEFIKLDTGMTEIIRPAMYGAQHPIVVINGRRSNHKKYIVVGHCCESSDVLTTEEANPEALEPRLLQAAQVGDLVAIESAGAYCNYFATQNYNSFPLAPEVLLKENGSFDQVIRRETLDEMLTLESST